MLTEQLSREQDVRPVFLQVFVAAKENRCIACALETLNCRSCSLSSERIDTQMTQISFLKSKTMQSSDIKSPRILEKTDLCFDPECDVGLHSSGMFLWIVHHYKQVFGFCFEVIFQGHSSQATAGIREGLVNLQ